MLNTFETLSYDVVYSNVSSADDKAAPTLFISNGILEDVSTLVIGHAVFRFELLVYSENIER